MDVIASLVSQYKTEADSVMKQLTSIDLHGKVEEYQKKADELKPQFEQIKDEVLKMVTNQEPLGEMDKGKFVNTCAWISVMLLAFTICGIFGYLFSPLISLFLSGFCMCVVAYIALPAFAVYELSREISAEADAVIRHGLLAFAATEGLLLGSAFSDLSVGTPPLAALSPILICVTSQLGRAVIGNDRTKFLGVTLGSGLVAHVIIGLVVGLYFPYLLLTTFYTAVGLVFLQIYSQKVTAGTAYTHLYQLGYFYGIIFSQALVYIVFGAHPEELQ